MKKSCLIKQKQRGYTLVELLIVLGMLSIVMMAIYSLYRTHQRTAYTQDEVVEVQQNLRLGMESITKDVRMAGFLIPYANTPVDLADFQTGTVQPLPAPDNVNSDVIRITTASATATAATVSTQAGAAFTVTDPLSVDTFSLGDVVTIIRPGNRLQPAGAGSTSTVNSTNNAVPSITFASTPGGIIMPGDLIVGIGTGGNYPNTITYCLGPSPLPAPNGCGNAVNTCPAGQLCLMRIVNITLAGVSTQVIAQNMAGLKFSYLMDNGTESNNPGTGYSNLNPIRAVRVTLIGQTVATRAFSDNQAKQRRIESVIMMRNRNQ